MITVHVYMGVLANPGTLRGMLEGILSRAWTKKHHPLWKPEDWRRSCACKGGDVNFNNKIVVLFRAGGGV